MQSPQQNNAQRSSGTLSNYSNGWGHLIATIGIIVFTGVMLFTGKLASDTCMAIMSPVVSFWFMTGSVNRFNASSGANAHATDSTPQP